MAEFTFGDLIQSAADAPQTSGGGPELDAPGKYHAEVVYANHEIKSSGKLSIGIKFQVTEPGKPKDGCVIWANQYLSPESPAALDIWFKTFEALGLPRDAWAKFGADLESAGAAASEAITGAQAQIVVKMEPAKNGYDARLAVKFVNRSAGAPQATAAAPGVGAVPSVPVPPAVVQPQVPAFPTQAPAAPAAAVAAPAAPAAPPAPPARPAF